MKFAYFTDEPPTPGTLLYTAFRRNMPRELMEVTVRNPVTFFYGIQQTGGMLAIQVRWINPDGALARTSRAPVEMDAAAKSSISAQAVTSIGPTPPVHPGSE